MATTERKPVTRWAVKCDRHTTEPQTKLGAERRKGEIEALGACRLDHEVVEVTR